MTPENKRIAKRIGWSLAAVAVLVLLAFVVFVNQTLNLHLDEPDLDAPPPEVKLAQWIAACDGPLRQGTSLEHVDAFVRALGYHGPDSKEPWTGRSFYRHYRKGNWVQYEVIDKDVLNRSVVGDIDIKTKIDIHDDVVSSCQPSISKHGR